MKLSPTELKKKYERSVSHKDHWRSVYEDAYKYALPMRNLYDGYYESNAPGQNKMQAIFDSTAIQSTQRFANRLQANIFPTQREWCRLVPGDSIPPEKAIEVMQILDSYTEKMFDCMRQSDFDMSMGEFLLELAIGTAVMLIQPGNDTQPIRYTTIPTFLITFEEGPHGTVDKVYRRMKRPFGVLEQEFPDITIPPAMRQQYENDDTQNVELIEGTYIDKQTGEYHYQIIDETGNNELVYRKLTSFPWVISRFMKAANERYGRGPVLTALPDIKTLNRVIELTLKNASLTIGGVFTAADDGVLNPATVSIVPGAIIPVSRNGGPQGESLRPLPRTGDPQLSQIVANDLRMSIKRILLDESLPPENMSARSATEINHKISELAQHLGASFGRIIQETMYPVVRRTLEVMDQLGLIDLPLRVNGLEIKVIPSSPLAMSQSMERVQEIMQFMQIAQSFGVEGTMAVKGDAVLEYIADQMSIPGSVRMTPEERQQMMAQMQQMQQMAMEAQQSGQTGEQAAIDTG